MEHFSILNLFSIGIGPSSSHTVGPMRAAESFRQNLLRHPQLEKAERILVQCYGSLAATGYGHATDTAIMMGLLGEKPESINAKSIPSLRQKLETEQCLKLGDSKTLNFIPLRDVDLSNFKALPLHPNGMLFSALNSEGDSIFDEVYYSTGGGFIATEAELSHPTQHPDTHYPYPYSSGQALITLCDQHHCSIADIVMNNELALHTAEEISQYLDLLWSTMKDCIRAGLQTSGYLPGSLRVPRRAKKLRKALLVSGEELLKDPLSILDWINLYAIAVSEENAAGGRIVTAPTNGAAGIIPAVLNYATKFCSSPHQDAVHRFLLTAGGIAILYKKNASISGADVGCQGEVGVACSMAAAGLTDFFGGTARQITNAAEIAMEHNLGLTCDPIAGLVQIPCIERNAIASVKALNASRIALRGTGHSFVSLDQVIHTMLTTGHDMMAKYKETAQGGLAVNAVNC